MARATDYNEATTKAICIRLAEGESLITICRDEDMPARSTVFLWLAEHEEFSDQYARAREVQADSMLDLMSEISNDGAKDWVMTKRGPVVDSECVGRSRLRVDTLKWQMSKLNPKKYSEKLDLNHSGSVVTERATEEQLISRLAELKADRGD